MVRDQMLADGNTWDIAIGGAGQCGAIWWHSTDTCIKNLSPFVQTRATELCGATPTSIAGCRLVWIGGYRFLDCKAKCKSAPQREVIVKGADSESLVKAGKCQKMGGIWLNGTCQIQVE